MTEWDLMTVFSEIAKEQQWRWYGLFYQFWT